MADGRTISVYLDNDTIYNLIETKIYWQKLTGMKIPTSQIIKTAINDSYEKIESASKKQQKKG